MQHFAAKAKASFHCDWLNINMYIVWTIGEICFNQKLRLHLHFAKTHFKLCVLLWTVTVLLLWYTFISSDMHIFIENGKTLNKREKCNRKKKKTKNAEKQNETKSHKAQRAENDIKPLLYYLLFSSTE